MGSFIEKHFAIDKEWVLPVWVAAAAKSALETLLGMEFCSLQKLNLLDGKGLSEIPVLSAGLFNEGNQAFGVSYCQSGAALDLTRGLEIWTLVQWISIEPNLSNAFEEISDDWLKIVPGVGVGVFEDGGEACLSCFAKDLLKSNLRSLVPAGSSVRLEIILPRGRELAAKTSNAAFGVIDGLALIGTQAEVQDSATPAQLQNSLQKLRQITSKNDFEGKLIFVIGENGLQLANSLGLSSDCVLKVGNWLGPTLVAAAEEKVQELLLFAYHGKLVKLAGGVFHTHHHLADARLEILTSLAVKEELPFPLIKLISASASIEDAFLKLKTEAPELASTLWNRVALEIEVKSLDYLNRYGSWSIQVGSALFDRKRCLRWAGPNGMKQLSSFGVNCEDF